MGSLLLRLPRLLLKHFLRELLPHRRDGEKELEGAGTGPRHPWELFLGPEAVPIAASAPAVRTSPCLGSAVPNVARARLSVCLVSRRFLRLVLSVRFLWIFFFVL